MHISPSGFHVGSLDRTNLEFNKNVGFSQGRKTWYPEQGWNQRQPQPTYIWHLAGIESWPHCTLVGASADMRHPHSPI